MVIQSALKQAFRSESWLAILEEIFHYEYLSLRPSPKSIEIKSAFQENILSGLQLGELSLSDDNNVLLLQITTQEKIDLSRNKIALRAFLIDLLDDSEFDAAIAVFEQADNPNWRISYVSRSIALREDGTHEEIQTAPRRFTFLVGKDEPTRTAAGQLAEINRAADQLDLARLEAAFAFEKLSNEFFDRYKALYALFLANILPSEPYLLQAKHPLKKERDTANGRLTPYPEHVPEGEDPSRAAATRALFGIVLEETPAAQKKADKPIRDFVKKLLGRLVFLTFLEKKRWLGCPSDTSDWNDGEPTFLKDYFAQAGGAEGATAFHSEFLTDLFFQALNTERPNDLFEKTGSRIPYLNGGLFDADPTPQQTLDFPPALFQTLLQFFGEYNFTIDENDPLNKEVGIDPEMLGHIFENLLEDNKDKGAYYTPKPVVSYMCQQSLLHYLQTHFGERAELSDLVTLHKAGDPEDPDSWCHQNAKKIANKLEEVKICDPAIGSGAFPIGMLNEIVHIRTLLNFEFHDPAERAKLKKSIIQKSIYGVDLDLGAVEIARLRFWLALVVDEVIPSPLPNLDYKIMQGNSLLESFGGVDLSNIENETDSRAMTVRQIVGGDAELALLDQEQQEFQTVSSENRSAILQARQKYFGARTPVLKAKLRETIDCEVINHIRTCLDFDLDKVSSLIDQHKKIADGTFPKPKKWNIRSAPKKLSTLQNQKSKIESSYRDLEAVASQPERPFFLWHLLFQDVFIQGGFDIVIANPPYGVNTMSRVESELLQEKFKSGRLITDPYPYFIRSALDLARKNGTVTLINSNAWLLTENTEFLRKDVTTKAHWIEAAILPPTTFNAVVDTHILLFSKEDPRTEPLRITQFTGKIFREKHSRNRNSITTNGNPINITFKDEEYLLIKKVLCSPRLDASCTVNVGVKPFQVGKGKPAQTRSIVDHKPFVFEGAKPEGPNWLPLLRGSLIEKHHIRWNQNYWIKYGPWLAEPRKIEIFTNQDKVFVRQTGDSLIAVHSSQDFVARNNLHVLVPARDDCSLEGLEAILNSRVLDFAYTFINPEKGEGLAEVKRHHVAQLPIPKTTPENRAELSSLAKKCAQAAIDNDLDSKAAHEDAINQIVYRLFKLTEHEINLIEATVAS